MCSMASYFRLREQTTGNKPATCPTPLHVCVPACLVPEGPSSSLCNTLRPMSHHFFSQLKNSQAMKSPVLSGLQHQLLHVHNSPAGLEWFLLQLGTQCRRCPTTGSIKQHLGNRASSRLKQSIFTPDAAAAVTAAACLSRPCASGRSRLHPSRSWFDEAECLGHRVHVLGLWEEACLLEHAP